MDINEIRDTTKRAYEQQKERCLELNRRLAAKPSFAEKKIKEAENYIKEGAERGMHSATIFTHDDEPTGHKTREAIIAHFEKLGFEIQITRAEEAFNSYYGVPGFIVTAHW